MSIHHTEKTAGINGGFEVSKKGLPVNWLMYTPETVEDADFNIILDQTTFEEGRQSLKFDVIACANVGGWHSPGFTNEFFDAGRFYGPGKYALRFWLKNNATHFKVTAGSVAAKEGDMRVILEGKQTFDWESHSFEIEVTQDQWLGFQLNVLSPGQLWIDDVQVEKIN